MTSDDFFSPIAHIGSSNTVNTTCQGGNIQFICAVISLCLHPKRVVGVFINGVLPSSSWKPRAMAITVLFCKPLRTDCQTIHMEL